MYVLGIETSCDETAASVVKDGRKILSDIVSSSLKFHQKYGGIVPEIASRMQLETVTQVTATAIKEAGLKLEHIDLISVTSGPGLLGSLLVGISFAKALALSLGIPLVGANHIYSHIYANFLNGQKIKLPAVALVVSGGHTSLFYLRDFQCIETLGQTQDDACGEAFDKVAKILRLSYPGGPIIEKLAQQGESKKIEFRCSNTSSALDFSFSGIKTAVMYYVRKQCPAEKLDRQLTCDIAASFQETVLGALVKKTFLAAKLKKVKSIAVGGGVAANNRLRQKFSLAAKEERIKYYFPPKELCLDNAAMVAGLGYQLFKKGLRSDLALTAELILDTKATTNKFEPYVSRINSRR